MFSLTEQDITIKVEEIEKEVKKEKFVALGLIGEKIKIFSFDRTGNLTFLGEPEKSYKIIHISHETVIWQKIIDELESLVNDPKTKEKDLQDFFEKYPDFILNDKYRRAHPKIVLEKENRKLLTPDFILEPFDQSRLCDLLELKLPSAKVYVLKKNRPHFSAGILEACAQLREYSNFFEEEENRKKVFEKHGLSAYKPNIFVIIGRTGKIDPLVRRRIERDFQYPFTVYTYNDIINRMKTKIKK